MICNSKKLSAAYELLKSSSNLTEFTKNIESTVFNEDVEETNIEESINIFKTRYHRSRLGNLTSTGKADKEFKDQFCKEYDKIFGPTLKKDMVKEVIKNDTTEESFEDRNTTEIIRDKNNKISSYKFIIKVQDKPDLSGILSREEMELICNLYSVEGSNLTQRTVSRYFPSYTLRDFKRVLRAFNITKAGSPMPLHFLEEKNEDELVQLALALKENNFLKKLEQEKVKYNERKVEELTKENIELKETIANIGSTLKNINVPEVGHVTKVTSKTEKSIILHLADLHIGAKVRETALFKNEYNYEEVKRRLLNLVCEVSKNKYDTIIVNLLGDMLDGMDQQTARRDHILPQNMDNFEQVKAFVEIMNWFTDMLVTNVEFNNLKFYSVRCGNHDGITGYVATDALFSRIKLKYSDIVETTIFTDFFGYYEFKGMKWILTHGKDDEFMKKGLPLNLTDATKSIIYDWLEDNNIHGKNIHFIKGDLHSDNLNSCYKLDYRNVLSLFGSSDYGSMNFARNNYGVSYELIDNGQLLRGTFIDL